MKDGLSPGLCAATVFLVICAGCTSMEQPQPGITVSSLDLGQVPSVPVGQFDVYTESFLVTNPTNATYDNVDVTITLRPTVTYCHAISKTFTYPEFFPNAKKTEQVSIAEFADLDCSYNYTYSVSAGNG